jgi:hypothetical protein
LLKKGDLRLISASAASFRPGFQAIAYFFDQLTPPAAKKKKRDAFSLWGGTNLSSSIRFSFTFQDLPQG